MVRMLISYTLAAGIMTPPALLSTQPSLQTEIKPALKSPILRTTKPVQPLPIRNNPSTVIPPPTVIPTPQTVAPQFVTYRPELIAPPSLENLTYPEPPISTVPDAALPVTALPPPPIETITPETADNLNQLTEITILREVVSDAHITSTAPLTAHDLMSGDILWETTEALAVQANNHQVLLDDQPHTELILTVPDGEFITVNGTAYSGGLILRAQDNNLYVINYLSGDQITAQPDMPIKQSHTWYDLDGRHLQPATQIAQHRSP
ncbi:MAG: hypothetical protein AAF821_19320 [Cyanobacteria bacterium P01_D01_bin.156]